MSDYIAICDWNMHARMLLNQQAVAQHVAVMQSCSENNREMLTHIATQLPKIGKGKGHRHKKKHVQPVDVFANYLDVSPLTWAAMFGPLNAIQVLEISKTLDWTKYRRSKLSCVNMTLLFIQRMHTGCQLKLSAGMFGVSISVAANIFDFVLYEFLDKYSHFVSWPTEDEEIRYRRKLFEVCELL